ncbi:Alpha/Beta hydrolase protein [Biscogniauxia marginata]|nr:Alpha/Beta hydrolase protein [Biscogniauxia marginata]
MAVDALTPNDPRVDHKFFSVGDVTYYYMLANPEGRAIAPVVLIHGWPDLGLGWRYQVPYLVSLGLQVIVPDMLGYGKTSAPASPEEYTLKKTTAHIAALIKATTDQPVILGGHDWGGAFAWRLALYYPELVRAVVSFCVPYAPPPPAPLTDEQLVERAPSFRYQLAIAGGAVEAAVGSGSGSGSAGPEALTAFLHGSYGGTTPEGAAVFTPGHGIHADRLARVRPSPLVPAGVIAHYAREYARSGLRGPCNWYRTRELNAADERDLARGRGVFRFDVPAMIVMAADDVVLLPELADGQERYFATGRLRREVVAGASHWVLIEKPEEANGLLGDFVAGVLGDDSLEPFGFCHG